MATTMFRLYTFVMLSICLYRFFRPFSRAWRSSLFIFSLGVPPWYFNDLIVATSTTRSGFVSRLRHFISRNFSAPRSAPKPASVMVYSPRFLAILVAIMLLQPCAMLAKGPPCMIAGFPSRVCTRLGFIASFSRTVRAPSTFRSLAYISFFFFIIAYHYIT